MSFPSDIFVFTIHVTKQWFALIMVLDVGLDPILIESWPWERNKLNLENYFFLSKVKNVPNVNSSV